MSDPLVFISKCWAGTGTKNGRVCRCRLFAWLGLLPLCCMAAGSLFGLAAHTWRMINTLAALHIRSVCRDAVCFLLPSSPEPRAYTAYRLCVLNYVCFMIYLTHPCVENVLHAFLAPFRQYVLSAFVCLAARSTHSQSQISRGGARRGAC